MTPVSPLRLSHRWILLAFHRRTCNPRAVTGITRSATVGDRDEILTVVKRAFSDPTRDGQYEVDIVSETWHLGASPEGLELVAEDAGAIIGHVLATVGDLDRTPTLGIAPLSVAPERQGEGVGTALMEELLTRIDKDGWLIVVLLGEPRYY